MKKLVIDTETTGLHPEIHNVLTIGMLLVDVTNEFLEILDEKQIFVKHRIYNFTERALEINKIDLIEHHKRGVFPEVAINQINEFVKTVSDISVLGHNVKFDLSFINKLYEKEGKVMTFGQKKIDTYEIWMTLKNSGAVPPYVNGSLSSIANYFGIENSNAHDSLADCYTTAKVYYKMLKLL